MGSTIQVHAQTTKVSCAEYGRFEGDSRMVQGRCPRMAGYKVLNKENGVKSQNASQLPGDG